MPLRRTLALLVLAAVPLDAQTPDSRSWNVCFTSAIGSCSSFSLSTAGLLDLHGNRSGTLIGALVSHHVGNGVASGLSSFSFYGTTFGGTSDAVPAPQWPLGAGAPGLPASESFRWQGHGTVDPSNATDPYANFVSFASDFTPGFSQFIGGCLGGNFDLFHQSSAVTCGATAAYWFTFASSVVFDASDVSRIAIDVYAGDHTGDFVPDLASCNASVDGSAGVGIDLGDPYFTASCTVSDAVVATPEPQSLALIATGLALFLAMGASRRIRGQRLATALLVTSLAACNSAERAVAPQTETDVTMAVSSDLMAAVSDAQQRVVPVLDVAVRPALQRALGQLHEALAAGHTVRSRQALDVLRTLTTGNTPSAGAADLAAIAMLVSAADQTLALPPSH